MKIDVDTFSGKLSILTLSHGNEETIWNVETYNRSGFQAPNSLFDNLNNYFKYLKKEEVDSIWKGFQNIYSAMETINDSTRLHARLQMEVKQLYAVLDFEKLKKWLLVNGNVTLPEDLKKDYGPEDINPRTRARTYLRDDYYDLVVLSIMLKPMVPIFGEYIRRVSKEIGTRFKEHYAFSLLSTSSIISLPALNRLRVYIEASVEKEEDKKSAIFGGLGTTELPDWLLSRAIVRRVSVSEENVGENIVANVWHTISQQINSIDKTFAGRIVEKRLYGSSGEDDNASIAENYKVKQEISDGDLLVLSNYTNQVIDMAKRVDPTIDHEKIKKCTMNAENNHLIVIQQHHITITQWVLAKSISPRGIPSLNKPSLLKAIAVTQAILWHWGFDELALLMFSHPAPFRSSAANITTTRLGKRYVDHFTNEYPHFQRQSNREQKVRSVNVACRAIDLLANSLTQHDWVFMGPDEIGKNMRIVASDNSHVVSAEIRQQLADLLIKIRGNPLGV